MGIDMSVMMGTSEPSGELASEGWASSSVSRVFQIDSSPGTSDVFLPEVHLSLEGSSRREDSGASQIDVCSKK
jgi:hypothetical protein